MHTHIDWDTITAPFDYTKIGVDQRFIRRWIGYERTDQGLVFDCRLADQTPVRFRVDMIKADVVRIRLYHDEPQPTRPGEMLVQAGWEPPAFEIEAHEDDVVLTTDQLRLRFQRFPWQMEAFDVDANPGAPPFFSQRIDDRAYGRAYEVHPTGFGATDDGREIVRETVAVKPGEAFYGFGEKFTPLEKWGQRVISWATDVGNVSSHRSYKNVPFFMSTAGYGLFVHTSNPVVYEMGTESSISYAFHILEGELDYFLIRGPSFKRILGTYTELTGRAPMPPKWSFGFWISRCGYMNRTEVEGIVQEMRARGFPCDVISLDPWWMGDAPWSTYEWDIEAFPNPPEMLAGLRDQHVRTCLWISPYVTEGCDAYEEGKAKGYFVQDEEGNISRAEEAFAGDQLAAVDFTNPEAKAWFQGKLERLLEMGAAVFKSDFGEQAPREARYHDGRDGIEMHNLYPLLYNKAVFETTERHFGCGLTWGRSGYAGSQRYPVQWGGDSYSSLDQMACQLRALLSYGLSGVPFCSHDVGGFDYSPAAFDAETQEDFPKDASTYARWLQFGVFSSHVRAHGKQPREPWSYGPEIAEIAHRYLALRYRLLPYIYTQAVKSTQTGLPMVRPLILEYQDDPNVEHVDLEYLFGDDFLVAPVVTRDGRRRVYLPQGIWFDYWTKVPVVGGRWFDVEAPLETLPLWVRAGAVIPMGPEMVYVGEKPLDPLTLEFYAPEDVGELVIYDEDRPEITVRYRRDGDALRVDVGNAPGEVEIKEYGVGSRE